MTRAKLPPINYPLKSTDVTVSVSLSTLLHECDISLAHLICITRAIFEGFNLLSLSA